jgi:ubiquinone/menaquinone biosynthesis C-methylase UbiE
MGALTHRVLDWLALRARKPDADLVRSLLAVHEGDRVLDVGGGTGAQAEAMLADCRVTVVDPDSRRVAYGRLRRPAIRFVEAAAESLPFPTRSFDAAMALVALHHMEHQPAVMEELRRVLAPGGRLVILEMDPHTGRGKWVHRCGRCDHHPAPQFRRADELTAMLEAAGFVEVRAQPAARGYCIVARAPG